MSIPITITRPSFPTDLPSALFSTHRPSRHDAPTQSSLSEHSSAHRPTESASSVAVSEAPAETGKSMSQRMR